jgi:hypothetical protein
VGHGGAEPWIRLHLSVHIQATVSYVKALDKCRLYYCLNNGIVLKFNSKTETMLFLYTSLRAEELHRTFQPETRLRSERLRDLARILTRMAVEQSELYLALLCDSNYSSQNSFCRTCCPWTPCILIYLYSVIDM